MLCFHRAFAIRQTGGLQASGRESRRTEVNKSDLEMALFRTRINSHHHQQQPPPSTLPSPPPAARKR
ncbi:hypothetical protein C0Q70_01732 [Pomacea canaliculata]|uniref:Uncharacterized protein n=1 Tax=Pomacea canaliculata TaxID=400727 RepID=A0A2T7Q0A6_POMCA|nr:hypothetical protein C0Q70_01732 [Pomacea canaliculata]